VSLRAERISFSYGQAEVLRDVSVSLSRRNVVSLLGPNGSGKSTLIKVLLGHLVPAAGSVLWEQRPLASFGRRELARLIAYLPQTPSAEIGQTVGDVLRLGRLPYWGAFGIESKRDAEVVARVAESLELGGLLHRRMDEVSGGQRQRVFLGRCLAQEPAAMLLDEPATYLDLRHQLELYNLLRRLADEQNIAVLMSSHDPNLAAAHADRLIVLGEGAILAEGPPEQVMRQEVLERAYGIGMRCVRDGDAVYAFPMTSP
jgi:ABC-type cobalamin/Fe3+-siderophores transport system ATPase subunit